MQATEFEYRHQALVHQFIVGAAFLTYFVDRDDIIWRFVKDSAALHRLERSFFIPSQPCSSQPEPESAPGRGLTIDQQAPAATLSGTRCLSAISCMQSG